jgi:hypothetical protein
MLDFLSGHLIVRVWERSTSPAEDFCSCALRNFPALSLRAREVGTLGCLPRGSFSDLEA